MVCGPSNSPRERRLRRWQDNGEEASDVPRIFTWMVKVWAIYVDKTGVGDYIVEDMKRGGLPNITDINFTDSSKESTATALKENMRSFVCFACSCVSYVDAIGVE